jgi:hypothetical protein
MAVLIAGYTYAFVPVCLMVVLTSYMSTQKDVAWTGTRVLELCTSSNPSEPFPGDSADSLRRQCLLETFERLDYLTCWVAIRSALQV